MIRTYSKKGAIVDWPSAEKAIWIDLFEPTQEEEQIVETFLERDVPTPAERDVIADSARNYIDEGSIFFTPVLLGRRDEGDFISGPVNFMLHKNRLVTIRNINPRVFEVGSGRASAKLDEAMTGWDVAFSLFEGAIERIADLLSEQNSVAYELAESILADEARQDLKTALKSIGRIGAIAALCQSSLSSLQRCVIFLTGTAPESGSGAGKLAVLRQDIEELERLSEALQGRMAFLQESALGLISQRQTDVLKAISIATIGFIPATLVASIFGMNFDFMHWYDATWGPPVAFLLMVLAPVSLFGLARWLKWF